MTKCIVVSLEYEKEMTEHYEQLPASKSDNLDETEKSLNIQTHSDKI